MVYAWLNALEVSCTVGSANAFLYLDGIAVGDTTADSSSGDGDLGAVLIGGRSL